MDDKTAKAIEQAPKSDFEGSGGLGGQLIELRDSNPRAYAEIVRKASEMAASDGSPQKATAMHDLQLVNDLDLVQQNLKSGNIQGLQTMLYKLSSDGTDREDRNFTGHAVTQGAADSGYIGRPAGDHHGNQGMYLHKPGSPYGLQLTAEGAVAYDWKTKKDLPQVSARQILSDWSKEAPTDAALRAESADVLKGMAGQSDLKKALSGDIGDLAEYFGIAYSHGYGGKSGIEAAQALSADLKKDSNVDVQIKMNPKYPGVADVAVVFKDSTLTGGWTLRQ
jgi:hypothetical protein